MAGLGHDADGVVIAAAVPILRAHIIAVAGHVVVVHAALVGARG